MNNNNKGVGGSNPYSGGANQTSRYDKERMGLKNLQIKATNHQVGLASSIANDKIKIAINAPLTTKNAGQPTRNSSNIALNSKNSFFNRVMQVSNGGTNAPAARNSRNGYQ
jgi:hypothetical protein